MIHSQIEVKFHSGKKKGQKTHWDICHNLDEFGLDIMDAFVNWSVRVEKGKATIDNFMNYVKSKDPENFICITKAQYDKITKE